MHSIFVIVCSLVLQSVRGHDEDVHTVQYTEQDFSIEVPQRNHFIMFYAPWCGHCQRLGPTWESLAEMLNEDKDSRVRVAKVDCTQDKQICSDQDVTGYPTLKFFKAGNPNGVKFRGTRDIPTLTNFIKEQLDEIDTSVPEAVNELTELTDETFDSHVSKGHHFVQFYAPSVGVGQSEILEPTWEKLAHTHSHDTTVKISQVNCSKYKSVCAQFDLKVYPTLIWIEDGKNVGTYSGDMSHEELKEYVAKMLGNSNKKNGDLDDAVKDNIQTVLNLTGETFEHGIEKGVTFIKFFAPWCGHCKRLAPTWDELGKKFIGNSDVHIVKVDCTLSSNKQLCDDQEVDGFPTLFLYKNGRKVAEYNGSRTLDDLHEFVSKYIQSHDEL